jgi:hypothetical protein
LLGALAAALAGGRLTASWALEGAMPAIARHFSVVGTISPRAGPVGQGFSAVQVAPRWAVTAAHIAPAAGWVFASDSGLSGIVEVLTFPSSAPTRSPIEGVPRDDIALLRLGRAISSPYYPRLADDSYLAPILRTAPMATLVSNNPGLKERRFGFVHLEFLKEVAGYSLAIATGLDGAGSAHGAYVVPGDSGSPVFMGHLLNSSEASILVGIASSEIVDHAGGRHSVYSRVGAVRGQLDEAVRSNAETLRWAAGAQQPSLP